MLIPPSTVISAVGTPPSAAAVTVTPAGGGCAAAHSPATRRSPLTPLSNGIADCRKIASRFSRCSVLTEDLPSAGIRPAAPPGRARPCQSAADPCQSAAENFLPGGGHPPAPGQRPRAAVGPGAFGSGVDRSADA